MGQRSISHQKRINLAIRHELNDIFGVLAGQMEFDSVLSFVDWHYNGPLAPPPVDRGLMAPYSRLTKRPVFGIMLAILESSLTPCNSTIS